MVGVGERNHVESFQPEDLHEHDGIGAIASGNTDDGIDAPLNNNPVYTLDPGAAVYREAVPLCNIDQPLRVRVGYKQVIQVNRHISRCQQDLYRDCGCDANDSHASFAKPL